MVMVASVAAGARKLTWRSLPDLPQSLGGQFVGCADGSMVVAGGTSWDKAPWHQGTKKWIDAIYALDRGAQSWRMAGMLPQPLAYGAAVEVHDGMVLFGGQTPSDFVSSVLLLTIRNGRAEVRRLGNLPRPLAMMNAVVAGRTVYLAGGQPTFTPTKALTLFLSIPLGDLLARKPTWKELPAWGGPGRFFAHLGAVGEVVYLAGGADLVPGPDGTPVRHFLADAHRYTPGKGWQRLPDMPRKSQAGVAVCHSGRFYVFGGSDGMLSESLQDRHPGFRLDVLEFDPASRQWSEAGRVPASLVTTGMTSWDGEYIIAGGEDRPGHRSAKVVGVSIGTR